VEQVVLLLKMVLVFERHVFYVSFHLDLHLDLYVQVPEIFFLV
jgi:hypothetical protein